MLRKDYFDFYDEFDLDIQNLKNLKGVLSCTCDTMIKNGMNSYYDELCSINCSILFLDNVITSIESNIDNFLEVLKND